MNNRPIKFRAWSLEYKQWMNHCSVIDSEGNILVLYYEQKEDGISPIVFDYPLDRVIIQQFTGLTDSTGKEIYEGDIVEYEPRSLIYRIGTITYSDYYNGWSVKDHKCYPLSEFGDYSLASPFLSFGFTKVIGNIFETPELLT